MSKPTRSQRPDLTRAEPPSLFPPKERERVRVEFVAEGHATAAEVHREVGHVVVGWQPGNGSRYDVSFARRAGGGWFGVWDGAYIVFKAYRDGIDLVAMPGDGELTQPDRAALRALCAALYAAGVLS